MRCFGLKFNVIPLLTQVDKVHGENKQIKMQLDTQYRIRLLIRISGIHEFATENTKLKSLVSLQKPPGFNSLRATLLTRTG